MQQQADKLHALEAAHQAMSPEQYSSLLTRIELSSIVLENFEAKRYADMSSGENRYSLNEAVKLINHDSDSARIEMKYTLDAQSSGVKILDMNVTYSILFQLQDDMPNDFFTIYNAYTLPQQTYPYFRELVDSTFAKMGFARLLLPIRKILIENEKDE